MFFIDTPFFLRQAFCSLSKHITDSCIAYLYSIEYNDLGRVKMTAKIIIKLYKDKGGNCPFEQWLLKLKNKQDAARIDYRIRRIEIDGHFGVAESIGEGI